MRFQGPRPDSGITRAKTVLNGLENDTKVNFQENIPGKVRFHKNWRGHGPPGSPFAGRLHFFLFVFVSFYGKKIRQKCAMHFGN